MQMPIHEMLRNVEADTTECYETIYKLIRHPHFVTVCQSPSIRYIYLHNNHFIGEFKWQTASKISI